jgi:glycosyltransferase involved in cell wall biosynthesis
MNGDPLRITVLCTDLGVRVPGDKGAALHLRAITAALGAIGHHVQLVGVAGHGPVDEVLAGRVEDMVLLPHPGRAEGLERERRKLVFVDALDGRVGARVEAFAPDLIYERLSLFGTAGVTLAERTGALHAIEVNALLAREEARWRGLHLADEAERRERFAMAHADMAFPVSDETAIDIARHAPCARMEVVPNGVELDTFAALPDRQQSRRTLGLRGPTVVFTGALRPWHGVDIAIRAVAVASQPITLVVAGDGPIRSDLETLAIELGVAHRVHFLGHLPHAQVAELLAGADAAVAPYPSLDGFAFSPLKLYEYLAAGVPVVASAIGQIPDALRDGRFGLLVPAGEPHELAEAIEIATSGAPAIAQMAAEARQYALAHHGWDRRAEQITAAMRPLVEGIRHALAE